MKFYKRFPGDIQIKTGHLTPAEFGCYDRLLDHYYATEAPIPDGRAFSICRAITKADRGAVERVLSEFFVLTNAGWEQARAAEMIAEAQPKIEAARVNGKKGGRPKKTTEQKPTGFSDETQSASGEKASQSQSSSEAIASAAAGASPAVDNFPPQGPEDPPSGPPPDKPRSPKAAALNACGAWLVANGLTEHRARELMGALIRDYPLVAVDAMEAAPRQADSPDPAAYLTATAKRMAGERRTVPNADLARSAKELERLTKPSQAEWEASEAARKRVMADRAARQADPAPGPTEQAA